MRGDAYMVRYATPLEGDVDEQAADTRLHWRKPIPPGDELESLVFRRSSGFVVKLQDGMTKGNKVRQPAASFHRHAGLVQSGWRWCLISEIGTGPK
jgi:hypothetical protein